MRYLSIVIFLLLVTPPALREYKKDKGENIFAKIFNFTISLLIFLMYTGTLKEAIIRLYANPVKLNSEVFVSIGILNPFLSGLMWIFYSFISFFLTVFAILLVLRKEKYRKLLLRLIPVWWLIESVHLYKYVFINTEMGNSDNLFLVNFLFVGIFFFFLFLLYSSKFMKRFFQYNNKNL